VLGQLEADCFIFLTNFIAQTNKFEVAVPQVERQMRNRYWIAFQLFAALSLALPSTTCCAVLACLRESHSHKITISFSGNKSNLTWQQQQRAAKGEL